MDDSLYDEFGNYIGPELEEEEEEEDLELQREEQHEIRGFETTPTREEEEEEASREETALMQIDGIVSSVFLCNFRPANATMLQIFLKIRLYCMRTRNITHRQKKSTVPM